MMLPVLKFSYSEVISPSKINVLQSLADLGGEADSLSALSEASGVEKSLLSYHLRGGREAKGLEELGLVEIDRGTQGRLLIQLSEMGRVLLIGFVMVRAVRARITRRQARTPSPREQIQQVKNRAQGRDVVHAGEAALLDTAQRLSAQLDVKAERLEQLIREADERLSALGAAPSAPVHLDDGLDDGRDHGSTAAAGPDLVTDETRDEPREPQRMMDPLISAVYELADEGRPVVEIARELDEQIGKVDLILALRASR